MVHALPYSATNAYICMSTVSTVAQRANISSQAKRQFVCFCVYKQDTSPSMTECTACTSEKFLFNHFKTIRKTVRINRHLTET